MIDLGTPARGLAFIRHIETEETYGNSPIIVTPKTRDKIAACQFIVVAAGDWEYCWDEDCERLHQYTFGLPSAWGQHPHDIQPGDWVLVRNRSWMQTPDPSVFVCKVDDIVGKFVET